IAGGGLRSRRACRCGSRLRWPSGRYFTSCEVSRECSFRHSSCGGFVKAPRPGRELPTRVEAALDEKYGLGRKRAAEPGIDGVLAEFVDRLIGAFGSLEGVRGKRILDIACGSNSSRSPDTGERTAMFEPWFCRLLLELGAGPVGVDAGDLEGERFEHYSADLSRIGALDFLADA